MGIFSSTVAFMLIASICLFIPKTAYAIVILPPIIIVSVVQIVVGVITLLTAPTSIISGIIVFLKKPKNTKQLLMRTLYATLGVIAMVSIFAAVIAKIVNPDRPWW